MVIENRDQKSQRKSELTRHNWTQHRAAIEAGQVVTPVRPFWLDLLDAEGQVVRGRGRGVRHVANDMARVVLQVFE